MYDKTPLTRWVGEGFVDIRMDLLTFLLSITTWLKLFVVWFCILVSLAKSSQIYTNFTLTRKQQRVGLQKGTENATKVFCCFLFGV